MKSALVLSFSPIASDPRVMRQVRSLASRFALTVAGFGGRPEGVADFVTLPAPAGGLAWSRFARAGRLLLRRFEAYYWNLAHVAQALASLGGRRFELVVANDVQALPLAARLAGGAPVLLDAHEFSPREFEDRLYWRIVHGPYSEYLCRNYLGGVRAMTTVAQGIAEAYATYGARPTVVHSAPRYSSLQPSPLQGERVRMIHHGAAAPSRKIECMLDVMDLLDERFELDLILVPGDARYIAQIARRVEGKPKVRMLAPVPMEQIVPSTNRYDVGMFLLPPTNFNYAHALPNKFFEFVQARLAVAIGPSPEMRRLAEQHGFGVVADSFEPAALAAKLNALTAADLARLKQNAHAAAGELCYECAEATFLAAVDKAMGRA